MEFGTNIFGSLQDQIFYLILTVIIIGALVMAWKRQFTQLIGFVIFMGLIGLIVKQPEFIVNLGEKIWTTVLG